MSFITPGIVPEPSRTKHKYFLGDVPKNSAFNNLSRNSSILRTRTPARKYSDFLYSSEYFNSSIDSNNSQAPTPTTSPLVPAPLSVLTQSEEPDLADKNVAIDHSIPTNLFTTSSPSTGSPPEPEPRVEPLTQQNTSAASTPAVQDKTPQSTPTPNKKSASIQTQRKNQWDKSYGPRGTLFVTPFLTSQITLPQKFLNFVEGIPWGSKNVRFKRSSHFHWTQHQTFESILERFEMKDILPFSIVWLPFFAELLDFALKRLFRISFCGYASLIVVCPFLDESQYLPVFINNPKHGSILLSTPVNFCDHQCILLFLNFAQAKHLTVSNDSFGIFDISLSLRSDFAPLESQSIVSHTSDPNCSKFLPLVRAKLDEAFALEQSRLDSRFQCPKFPALKVNDFVKRTFDFDVTSIAFHYTSPRLVRKYFPRQLFPRPKDKVPISYQRYNEMCGDDSKITQNSIPSEELFCSMCGKFGHETDFCWMRLRSSKDLGLTSPTDLALNEFLLSYERAPSFVKLRPEDCIILFVTNLMLEIHARAKAFTDAWTAFARYKSVSANLIEPGFSQLRQGLAYWYAIACPIYVLQWIAFGIPVFWQSNARPPTFEVKPPSRKGVQQDSSPVTLKAVKKFLDMSFLLPIVRDQAHCCAPLFDRESSGKMRSIHDLRLVNRYIMAIAFTLFTAFNFCTLVASGSVFIITDFSSCWHQLRHLIKDMRFFAFRTIENGHSKYWLPQGKTFGESDVPFAITHLVSFITCLFNLFTLCSFWIDDGIIKVGNIHDANWIEVASCIRSFTAELFSALCLLVNQKCDFQPSIEKPWVGLWNTAEGTFIQAAKLQKFGEIILDVLSAGHLSLSQAETLGGKINSFGLGLDTSFELKLLNSFLKSVSRILSPKRDSKPKLPISENFGTWILNIFDILLQSLTPQRSQFELMDLPLITIACDASNIGSGLVISYLDEIIFETAIALPHALSFHSNLSQLESSSTDVERFAFETLALQTAKHFLDGFFPNTMIQLKIFTDNLPLAIQLTTGKLRSFRAVCDANEIFKLLNSWGMPYTISYHSRDTYLGKLADACTRYYIPILRQPFMENFRSMTSNEPFFPLDVSATLLNTTQYFLGCQNIIMPLNLPTNLYAKLFRLIADTCTSRYLFCPKISHFQSLLSAKFSVKFEFHADSFIPHQHAFTHLPYLLYEFSETPTQRNDSPKSLRNQGKFLYSTELRLGNDQKRIDDLLQPQHAHFLTSRENMHKKTPVTPSWLFSKNQQ